MANCKECYHYEVCRMHYQQKCELTYETEKEVRRAMLEAEKGSPICDHFKDRSRFVELPCKVGDTVYIIARISGKEKIIQDSVESLVISFFADNTPIILFDGIKTCDWDSSDFGKRVFLTKEQAEQALKERDNNAN